MVISENISYQGKNKIMFFRLMSPVRGIHYRRYCIILSLFYV